MLVLEKRILLKTLRINFFFKFLTLFLQTLLIGNAIN